MLELNDCIKIEITDDGKFEAAGGFSSHSGKAYKNNDDIKNNIQLAKLIYRSEEGYKYLYRLARKNKDNYEAFLFHKNFNENQARSFLKEYDSSGEFFLNYKFKEGGEENKWEKSKSSSAFEKECSFKFIKALFAVFEDLNGSANIIADIGGDRGQFKDSVRPMKTDEAKLLVDIFIQSNSGKNYINYFSFNRHFENERTYNKERGKWYENKDAKEYYTFLGDASLFFRLKKTYNGQANLDCFYNDRKFSIELFSDIEELKEIVEAEADRRKDTGIFNLIENIEKRDREADVIKRAADIISQFDEQDCRKKKKTAGNNAVKAGRVNIF